MTLRCLSWLTLCLCLASMLAAQPHTAPWTAFGPGSSPTDPLVARVDPNGLSLPVFLRSSLPMDNQVWGGTVSTYVTLPSSLAILDVRPDRTSAQSERLFATTHPLSGTFYLIDDTHRSVTSFRSGGAPGQSLVPPREVASCRTAPGRWEFRVHFEGQPKQPFAMALSLAGMRPGMLLPDGRKILLQPDVLTYLSLSGRLAPVLTGNLGVLDPEGRAVVSLDLQNAPTLTGFNLFGLVITLDPLAPVGLRTIADPIRIRL
jgi:hypothetical protein